MNCKKLRSRMREIAPRVSEITGLNIPRKYGHYVHPRIKYAFHPVYGSAKRKDLAPLESFYGRYQPSKRTIHINGYFAANAAHPDLIDAIIAHEYTHYLQDLYWSVKDWNDTNKSEKHATTTEIHFVPDEYKPDLEKQIRSYD